MCNGKGKCTWTQLMLSHSVSKIVSTVKDYQMEEVINIKLILEIR